MRIDRRLCGWKRDDDERDKLIQELGRQGTLYGAKPELRGNWARLKSRGVLGVFLFQAVEKFHRGPTYIDAQQRGTCVSRGTYYATQCSVAFAATKGRVTRPVIIAYEPIYWISRNIILRGQLRGDGSTGAAGARAIQMGYVERKRFSGRWDLSRDQEELACDDDARPPQDLFDEMDKHHVRVLNVNDSSWVSDCLSGGKGVARCHNTIYGDRNNSGMSIKEGDGAHCQAMVGVFVTENGDDGYVERQSWGENAPGGQTTLRYAGGTIELPSNCYGITAEQYDEDIRRGSGEAWAFDVDELNTHKPPTL